MKPLKCPVSVFKPLNMDTEKSKDGDFVESIQLDTNVPSKEDSSIKSAFKRIPDSHENVEAPSESFELASVYDELKEEKFSIEGTTDSNQNQGLKSIYYKIEDGNRKELKSVVGRIAPDEKKELKSIVKRLIPENKGELKSIVKRFEPERTLGNDITGVSSVRTEHPLFNDASTVNNPVNIQQPKSTASGPVMYTKADAAPNADEPVFIEGEVTFAVYKGQDVILFDSTLR